MTTSNTILIKKDEKMDKNAKNDAIKASKPVKIDSKVDETNLKTTKEEVKMDKNVIINEG